MNDSDRLVCVREFWTEIEASIAMALLRENGIECTTQGGRSVPPSTTTGA